MTYSLVWVWLPFLPFKFWKYYSLKQFSDGLGSFIQPFQLTSEMKMISYARTSYPRSQQIHYGENYYQTRARVHCHDLDYKNIPFKCRACHEYNHSEGNHPLWGRNKILRTQKVHSKELHPRLAKKSGRPTRNKFNSRKRNWPSIWRALWFQVPIFLPTWLFLLRISLFLQVSRM